MKKHAKLSAVKRGSRRKAMRPSYIAKPGASMRPSYIAKPARKKVAAKRKLKVR